MPRDLVPPGRPVELPGRGTTWVVEHPGADHAGGAATTPPIVLLHGITGGSGINFSHLYPALADHRVIALDQRAHGRGIRSHRPKLVECADDVAALLDALSIERAVVVGYSMGGAVAQAMTLAHPERVSGLVLWATAARFSHGTTRRRLYRFAPVAARAVDTIGATVGRVLGWDELAHLDRHEQAWVSSEVALHDSDGIESLARDLGRFDARDRLDEIATPTAVLVTARDRIIPPDRQLELGSIPDAEVVDLARAGHSSVMAHPERVVDEAAAHITRLVTRTRS